MSFFKCVSFSSIPHAVRLGAIVSTMALAPAFSAYAGTVSFTDNFSPSASSSWNDYAGNWTTSGGTYYAQTPNNDPYTITALPYDVTNYTLSVTVNNLADAGIFLRSDGTNDNVGKVQLILGGNGYGQGSRGGNAGTSIYFCTSALGCGVDEVDGVFTPGDTYTVSVTASGDTYSVYINGSKTAADTFVDASDPTQGEVGLYDDQPNTTTGSGSGIPNTFSDFSLNGTLYGTTSTPEPASLTLLALGLAGVGAFRCRRGFTK